jgi:hypothetical protein
MDRWIYHQQSQTVPGRGMGGATDQSEEYGGQSEGRHGIYETSHSALHPIVVSPAAQSAARDTTPATRHGDRSGTHVYSFHPRSVSCWSRNCVMRPTRTRTRTRTTMRPTLARLSEVIAHWRRPELLILDARYVGSESAPTGRQSFKSPSGFRTIWRDTSRWSRWRAPSSHTACHGHKTSRRPCKLSKQACSP